MPCTATKRRLGLYLGADLTFRLADLLNDKAEVGRFDLLEFRLLFGEWLDFLNPF